MSDFRIEHNIAEVRERLAHRAEELKGVMARWIKRASLRLEREIKLALTDGQGPVTDTGHLRASWTSRVVSETDPYHAVVGSNSKYAAIHEYGGTITPKRAQWLTIPLNRAARRVPARDMPNLFFFRGRAADKAYLAEDIGRGRINLMYVLVKSVTLPARRYISRARARAVPLIREDLERDLNRLMRGEA